MQLWVWMASAEKLESRVVFGHITAEYDQEAEHAGPVASLPGANLALPISDGPDLFYELRSSYVHNKHTAFHSL